MTKDDIEYLERVLDDWLVFVVDKNYEREKENVAHIKKILHINNE